MSACVEKMVLPTCAESDHTQQLLPTRTRNSKADFIRTPGTIDHSLSLPPLSLSLFSYKGRAHA
jgi:hypothetical protein